MNYEQFICAMLECTNSKLPENARAERQEILKNNGVRVTGLAVRRQGSSMAPLIYLEEFYNSYLKGSSVEELADRLLQCSEHAPGAPEWDYRRILDFEKVKEQVIYKLVDAQKNAQLLKDVPNLPILEFALIFYVLVPVGQDQEGCSVMIRNSHLDGWRIPISVLYEAAVENTPKLCPGRFCSLDELVMAEITENHPLFVLTNERGLNGAAALFYPGMPEKIYERLECNYYLIPSSVHEFIIVPDLGQTSSAELQQMLLDINETEVAAEDVLSEHIYYYDGDIITKM